ncbi:acyl-ACP--UDP-N-acetylglucosamine O-acyltransferase [Botrimarina hoheduenensis]|uniref:Acyl-[acyl-carrier-protein]--UDP-N-acetylglucosamine O-acyltransferase n=1 Tax=Botrimarina hoheduenensis TaxID=2528000 RepID=A0A5C5WC36_9BACT|nr:acyl-ACP--UDP-N-acetylglucosamine O-acyltransferase [Botrimarina hoheduenensis]TWT47639.1 Acyl-[acyl-carrier-protein]--UDP-N-acetylglucosamine O-acyltransferase [Botrimarina hoheduenensis]
MTIHPTAVISAGAQLGKNVQIGPFCTVEAGVRLGDGVCLAARSTIKTGVAIGCDSFVGEGAVVGGLAQHLTPPENAGGVVIGERNVLRENVTVHRAMHADQATRIGNDCLLMVGAHVAHDVTIGDRVVLTNNVMLAGHVTVGDRAYVGGGAAVHQFCRIGRLAMVGGMARVVQDVLPFVTVDGGSGHVVGLNRVGLRRAGFDRNAMAELKQAYQIIYRSGLSLVQRLEALTGRFDEGLADELAEFLSGGGRGFVRERRTPPGATIRVLADEPTGSIEPLPMRKAG